MAIIELFSPAVRVDVGPYVLTSGVELEIYSDSRTAWATLQLAQAYAGNVDIPTGARATIRLGYGDVMRPVLAGTVCTAGPDILIWDDMAELAGVTITDTFMDVTPQDLVQAALRAAGITRYCIGDTLYPPRDMVVVSRQTGLQLLGQIDRLWGISGGARMCGDTFYWGATPPQETIYQLVYGRNILQINQISGGTWELETVSVPFIRYGDYIAVSAPDIAGVYPVSSTRFTVTPDGFVRSKLQFFAG